MTNVPQGELRWLIERDGKYVDGFDGEIHDLGTRQFWTGDRWSTSALDGARYPTQEAAQQVIGECFTKPNAIVACEHMFQCGIEPVRLSAGEGGLVGEIDDSLVDDGKPTQWARLLLRARDELVWLTQQSAIHFNEAMNRPTVAEYQALQAKLAEAERDAARWNLLCNLWAASTELSLTQDEDGRWSLTVIEPVEGLPAPGKWTGDDPDAAIDLAADPSRG